jgi:hypothetical protein
MQNPGMVYGYARVSTDTQDLSGQLRAAGCEKEFREKVSRATAEQPQLKKLMAALAPGDAVVIPAVDGKEIAATLQQRGITPETSASPPAPSAPATSG